MSDVEKIEMSIEAAKEKIEKANSLLRLENNADFKEIFSEGYLEKYAVSLVHRKTMIGLQDEMNQKYLDSQIIGISAVKQYMNFILTEAALAEETLADDEEERARILEEEG